MDLAPIRRVAVAGLALDADWSHSPNTDADWDTRGFIRDADGIHGARIPPGKSSRIVGVCVKAEDSGGVEIAGQGGASISIAMVQLVNLGGASFYRQRVPDHVDLRDLVGEVDITRNGTRLFPRITELPRGLSSSVVTLAFYVGVL
ncbi:MAG: hypothetical protein ACTSX8_02400 [Alphaproteobacteria bacterium]